MTMKTGDLFALETGLRSHVSADVLPKTRFQGSKRKLAGHLSRVLDGLRRGLALDLYSGSGSVTLLLRLLGFQVISNDYLRFANNTAKVFLTMTPERLRSVDWQRHLDELLLYADLHGPPLVHDNFADVFFTPDENLQIDRFCQNVCSRSEFERAVLTYAVGQALLMKRPYNLFHRANLYMRLQDVKRSFGNATTWAKPIATLALKAIRELKAVPVPEPSDTNLAVSVNTSCLEPLRHYEPDVIYADPPYISGTGQVIDYADFYHFLEGLIDYPLMSAGDASLAHKPIVRMGNRWSSASSALCEIREISQTWPRATIVMSYRDDGQPTIGELEGLFRSDGRDVTVSHMEKYKYALSHSTSSHEATLLAWPSVAKKM